MTRASRDEDGDTPSVPEAMSRPFAVEMVRIAVPAGRRAPAGADTMAIVDRLAALDPAAVPAPPPRPIAGLDDLVEVGRGGMGIVYRARETRLGPTVAVKVLGAHNALTDEGRLRAESLAATGRHDEAIADLRRILEAVAPWTENLPAGHEPPAGFVAAAAKARAVIASFGTAETPAR